MTKITVAVITLACLAALLAGMANGIMDTATFHYANSRMANWNPEYWNPAISWCNKWRDCQPGVERFPFSSTALVALTDGWHLCKLLYTTLLYLSSAVLVVVAINVWQHKSIIRWHAIPFVLLVPLLVQKTLVGIGFWLMYDVYLPLSS